ncbi:ferritin-4, chloroplastic-like isoform X1 [Zingiber officinale]|uniref:ferritin-4, chloroplastic-like isoform X1 n=1 Tax=Zingiber officinale TaxID=94328 RepID=UPI001C4D1AF3|nr:ferritin-4, chloroplastic-like isoform X1 [Zingiber officinale]
MSGTFGNPRPVRLFSSHFDGDLLASVMPLPAPTSRFSISSPWHSPSVLSFPAAAADRLSVPLHSELRFPRRSSKGGALVISMASGESDSLPIYGGVFRPFEEIKQELALVPSGPDKSLARQKYSEMCEVALNEQINVEYNVSYVYHAMFAYFDRDNIALTGFANFFESSDEKRDHVVNLMEYQNKRGGRVKLQSILMPLSEYDHPEKEDALHAMELSLSLEKLTNEKLLNLHRVAQQCHDAQLADFIDSDFLRKQVGDIEKISEYVAQLRRVGKGYGVWHFDQMLLQKKVVA